MPQPSSATGGAASNASAPPAALRIYNTLSRTKESLTPVVPGQIGMYLCGPTVYKPSHIGHMVGPVIFDAIKRYLMYCGYKVTWVVNITDVDDKLIVESRTRNMSMAQLATEMTADYMHNLELMGVDTIDHFPKATDNIDEIIRFTGTLVQKGFAYVSDGDVYFDVGRDPEYGKLSRRTLDSLHGEGGEMAERKRSPADFALWKSAKPGEPSWDSPWGKGRPGWHIECSAMSRGILGETFDIHGGGLDLIFPHHENEIAQSECCHGQPQAKYWLHNGLMQAAGEAGKVGGRAAKPADGASANSSATAADPLVQQATQGAGKISKSTGALPFSDLLKRHAPEAIRFFLLSTHYRSPIQYSEEFLDETAKSLEKFYQFFKRYERVMGKKFYDLPYPTHRAADDSGALGGNGTAGPSGGAEDSRTQSGLNCVANLPTPWMTISTPGRRLARCSICYGRSTSSSTPSGWKSLHKRRRLISPRSTKRPRCCASCRPRSVCFSGPSNKNRRLTMNCWDD